MHPIQSLAALLLALPLTAQEVGTRLSPALAVHDMAQTPAQQLSDFAGRAVVIEFFAHWCGPCARAVPHMNEIHARYGPRGLSIVSVTSDTPEQAEPWVEKNGMKYAYGYDRGGKLQAHFGVNSIPHAILVDAFGTIVWRGHPMQMPEEAIERALIGASSKPVWDWPEEARGLARPLWAGDWKAAAAVTSETPAALAILEERAGAAVTLFDRLVEQEEYAAALTFGRRTREGLSDLPAGAALAGKLTALEANPAAQADLRYAELEQEALTARKVSVLEELRPKLEALAKEHAGTAAARKASKLLKRIESALAKYK
jgi:thiol-disulfide isomerase/thioredoxin